MPRRSLALQEPYVRGTSTLFSPPQTSLSAAALLFHSVVSLGRLALAAQQADREDSAPLRDDVLRLLT